MTVEIIISQEQPSVTPVTDNGFVESVEITCYSQLLEIIDNQCNVPWVQANIKFLNTIKGVGISNIEKTSTVGLVDTYTITYTDGTTTTFDVTNGIEGGDGRGIVSILKTSTQELTDTYTITYTDDTTSTFEVTNGVDGVSVKSITLYETLGLVDTYEIIYSTGSRSYFNVTNGAAGIDGIDGENGITPTIGLNGNWYIGTTDTGVKAAGTDGTNGLDGTDGVGISNIEKTGTILNVDEYTITFTDASTFLFYVTNGLNGADGTDGLDGTNGTNGRGIVNIIKTSTVGLVDTYTVTYSDSTNSTFDVTNGEKGEEGTSAYEIYLSGGGTLSEAEFNESITEIPTHIEDATKHIDTTTDEFSGTIDETNDKFTIWDNSLLKWIRFSFTSLKTYLNGIYHKFGGSSFGAKQIIGSTDYQDFGVKTNNIERVTILKGGTVLINLTTGAGGLEVGGESLIASAYNGILRFQTKAGANQNALKMGAIAGAGANGYAWIQGSHVAVDNAGDVAINPIGGSVIVGGITPKSKLQVAGGIQCGDDTAAASADKVGTTRYRATANASYVEMCMQVSANSYSWVAIVTNTW